MVKKFIKTQRVEEDEDLSDLEVDIEGEGEETVNIINDEEGLIHHVERIKSEFHKLMKNQHPNWLETMDLTAEDSVDPDLNVDDDIKRELIFYNLSLANAGKGISKLKESGEKLNRPGDFFAEMLKGDNQMDKVKKRIIHEQQRIKKLEEKKNKMQNIKFAKAMKDSQNKEKSAFKRRTKEGIENWKKHIKKNPNDYDKIDDFMDGKREGKFGSGRGRFNSRGGAGRGFSRGASRVASRGGRFGSSRGSNRGGRFGSGRGGFDSGKFSKFGGRDRDSHGANNKFQGRGGKQEYKRPGKIKRMIQRNKKNSKK